MGTRKAGYFQRLVGGDRWHCSQSVKTTIETAWSSPAERAGVADVDLLTLRRTCATHFGQKANTKDTQAQMRHSDPATTLKYYQQSIPESVKKAAVALEAEIMGIPKRSRRSAGTAKGTRRQLQDRP
ncbi:MAG TPA: hypothetical protein VHW09_26625 [Bryobacteraceae bacterium]|nr:hypothetical protein [Bryobacteraceae bacterium]